MKDSYQDFFDRFNISKSDLYNYGVEAVISADFEVAKDNYNEIKRKLFNNEKLSIRGYGRNGRNSNLYLGLYSDVFGNSNIVVDPTNNAAPRRNISNATGYRINSNLINYQVAHIWGRTKNPILFESVWNICFVPRLFDPFTGHECKGGWNDEFIPILNRFIYDKFENIINDYNQLITSNDIENKIENYVNGLLASSVYDVDLINRFKNDAVAEWIPIIRP